MLCTLKEAVSHPHTCTAGHGLTCVSMPPAKQTIWTHTILKPRRHRYKMTTTSVIAPVDNLDRRLGSEQPPKATGPTLWHIVRYYYKVRGKDRLWEVRVELLTCQYRLQRVIIYRPPSGCLAGVKSHTRKEWHDRPWGDTRPVQRGQVRLSEGFMRCRH